MPKDHSLPINEADRQARAAFKAYAGHCAANGAAQPVAMNPRTFDRIVAGRRDVPPGAAREMAARIREDLVLERRKETLEAWAAALELWARDCDTRSKGADHA